MRKRKTLTLLTLKAKLEHSHAISERLNRLKTNEYKWGKMAVDIISAGIGAFAGIAVAAISTFGPTLSNTWLERRKLSKANFTDVFDRIRRVYGILNDTVSRIGSERAMVMYTENNGGIPQVGCQLYVTIVNEVYHHAGQSISADFRRYPIDESYAGMLGVMLGNERRKVIVVTKYLPPCLLKQIYEHAGTKMSIVCVVKETKRKLYYASFNFRHDNWTDELEYDCDLQVNKLRQLFKDVV